VTGKGSVDQGLRSWVEPANEPSTDFPIQNLPFGVFRAGEGGPSRVGLAIGDRVLDLAACAANGMLSALEPSLLEAVRAQSLDALMAAGNEAARQVRLAAAGLLEAGNGAAQRRAAEITLPVAQARLLLPVRVGDYTDFYASVHHATNVGSMFRPENPLLPNYKYVPVGYHGRASSIVVSGTPVRRPMGQTRDDPNGPPVFGASRRLDYELEVGAYVGTGNRLGMPIPLAGAEEHIWGLSLVNDWSARDIQAWEYQPLGPFLAKNFATSVSPWVVTLDALEPYRVPSPKRPAGDPAPLPYLSDDVNVRRGAFDLILEVWIQSEGMRDRGIEPMLVSRGSFSGMYWTLAQLLTHHASNGCNLRPGDLLASGTVSGATVESRGCLLERTWRGTEPLELPDGDRRAFLQDGDEVIMRGYAERDGFRRVGFGECRGRVSATRLAG
jgi:fumarylacetoacetase